MGDNEVIAFNRTIIVDRQTFRLVDNVHDIRSEQSNECA
jgi:hypothetical protein